MINRIVIVHGKYNKYSYSVNNNTLNIYSSYYGTLNLKTNYKSIIVESKDLKMKIIGNQVQFYNFILEIENHVKINIYTTNMENIKIIKNYLTCKHKINWQIKLIKITIKMILKSLIYKVLVENTELSIEYIRYQPIGIKQNTVIKENLFYVFWFLVSFQKFVYKNIFLFCTLLDYENLFTKFTLILAFKTQNCIANVLQDCLELTCGKTYNKLRKRYDYIVLSLDHVIITVLITSLSFLVYANVICYIIYYIILYVLYMLIELIIDGVSIALGTSYYLYICKYNLIPTRVSFYSKIRFIFDIQKKIFMERTSISNIIFGKHSLNLW